MKNKIILLLLITFLSCSETEEEEICNGRENSYERTYESSNSHIDRLINQRYIDGCYTLEEARVKQWHTSDNYTIIQCDDYL